MADTSITREERYLEYLTGDRKGNVPKPVTRRERYLYELCLKGIGGEISPEEIKNAVNEYLEKNPVKPGATTEQAAQIEQNKKDVASLKEDISTKITKFYASNQGETHLSDSDNGKIMDMMVYGKSEQKQYSGKNLVDASKVITGDLQEGIVSNGNNYITDYVEIDDSEEYIISGCLKNNYENAFYDENKQFTRRDFNYTIIPQKGEKYVRIEYVNNGDKKIMLEKGSTSTAFEPYTGGIPSPNPDYPQEIKSVVNPTVKVCGKNLLKATLRTTTKNGVTCTANGDGTYTLNGTATSDVRFFTAGKNEKNKFNVGQTIRLLGSDENANVILYKRKADDNNMYGQIISSKGNAINDNVDEDLQYYQIAITVWNNVTVNAIVKPMLTTDLTATYDDFEPYHEQTVTLPYTLNAIPVNSDGNITIDGQQYVADYVDVERGKLVKTVDSSKLDNTQSIVGKTEWLLAEPQEIDLTTEEITAFKALATYYPVTNVSVNSEQLDGYTVFNYPISMANGWNYVKQQIGDTREYIYDMDTKTQDIDTQAAEAYVNSEYAVALTELEV